MKNNETCHCEVPESYRTINKCYVCDCVIENTKPIEYNKDYSWNVVFEAVKTKQVDNGFYQINFK
jgi:hypothetical protein